MRLVQEVVFKVRLSSRSRRDLYVGSHNVGIFIIPPSTRGQLYVEVPPWCGEFLPTRPLPVPTPPVFAYNSSPTLGPAHVDSDVCSFASCVMCALVSCTYWTFVCFGVVDGFARDQRIRLYTNRKFQTCYWRLPSWYPPLSSSKSG